MRRTWVALALVLASAGCHRGDRRGGEVDPSTISRNRASFAPGSIIPAAGFGVDLVRRRSGNVDPATTPASAPVVR